MGLDTANELQMEKSTKGTIKIPKDIMMSLRHAIMGSEAAVYGPSLWESMEKLGYKKCIERLETVIKMKSNAR